MAVWTQIRYGCKCLWSEMGSVQVLSQPFKTRNITHKAQSFRFWNVSDTNCFPADVSVLWGFRSWTSWLQTICFGKWLYVLLGQNIMKNRRVFVSFYLYLILHVFQNTLKTHTSAVRCLNFLCFASRTVLCESMLFVSCHLLHFLKVCQQVRRSESTSLILLT